jgi:hypothetical protein
MSIIEQKQRIETLMGLDKLKQQINENKDVEFSKKGADGHVYAIVREQHKYYIMEGKQKKGLMVEDLSYVGGIGNKHRDNHPTYERALTHLQLKLQNINESINGVKNNKPIDCFKSEFHLLEEQIKRNKNNANKDSGNWNDMFHSMKVNFNKKNSEVTLLNENKEFDDEVVSDEFENIDGDNVEIDVVADDDCVDCEQEIEYLDYKSLFELISQCNKNKQQITDDLFNLGVTEGNELGVPLTSVEKILSDYDVSIESLISGTEQENVGKIESDDYVELENEDGVEGDDYVELEIEDDVEGDDYVELDEEYEIEFDDSLISDDEVEDVVQDGDEIVFDGVSETAVAGSRTHQTGRKQHTKLSTFPDSRLRPEDKKKKGEIEENTTAGGVGGGYESPLFKNINENIKKLKFDILSDVKLKKK